jgi:hypothetical protein
MFVVFVSFLLHLYFVVISFLDVKKYSPHRKYPYFDVVVGLAWS